VSFDRSPILAFGSNEVLEPEAFGSEREPTPPVQPVSLQVVLSAPFWKRSKENKWIQLINFYLLKTLW
jgi:hypothetical protein